MKWMIRVDMEGLTGVVNMTQVVPGASGYPFGQKMLMHDLQAVLEGLLQDEKDEVWLYDIHFFGTNVDFDLLDPRVTVICGKPNYTPANQACLQGGFDGMILLGLHARAGIQGALLAHNYEHDIRYMSVNGLAVGEIGLEALIAGEAGVPLVMVTGDSEGNREARELVPNAITVTVKESLGDTAAACYPPSITRERLIDGARRCRTKAAKIAPLRKSGETIELLMQFKQGELLQKLQNRVAADQFADPDRIVFRGRSVVEAWEQYLIVKGN